MRVALAPVADDGAVVALRGAQAPGGACIARYTTRTGALLRIGGVVRGAFDREHRAFDVPVDAVGPIELIVERRSLPQSGLPSGDGFTWRRLLATANQRPRTHIVFDRIPDDANVDRVTHAPAEAGLSLLGHSHLDVAWLWTYDEAIRKAVRTLATAVRQLERVPAFIFAQTTPQLFADVAAAEPELFMRMRALAAERRLDVSGAALWVECDCNVPSGESLLRQMIVGSAYIERAFGISPTVAWLPDSFGFANTLPTLLQHAGIGAFGTTKLGWNESTTFPYARFWWEGPDGSRVVAANVASIEGEFAVTRVARAKARGDLLLVGRGDGGGGVSDAALAIGPRYGTYTTFADWFGSLRGRPLPVVHDELYLETHRGTLTSQREIKMRNAALERALGQVELALAWAVVLRATPFFVSEARAQLARAWQLTLRAQFHDVLPGSAIAQAYVEVRRDYDEAESLVAGIAVNVAGALPSAARRVPAPDVEPLAERGGLRLRNERISAWIAPDGCLRDLRLDGGRNLVRAGLRVACYVDRPKRWDAWNLDRGYRKRRRPVNLTSIVSNDRAVIVSYVVGKSALVMRVSLAPDATALAVDMAVAWNECHRILRLENAFTFAATRARFGSPHGFIERPPRPRTAAERAKFEAAGQRFARVEDAHGGVVLLTRDTYGWSLSSGRATHLGNSLVRGPMWPEPDADAGEHRFAFALRPFHTLGMGELESEWERFAHGAELGVPMFTCEDPAIVVAATKPADDGDGIVVRVRECDGSARSFALRCGVRARGAVAVDARERPIASDVRFEGEAIVATVRPYEVRTFRVAVG